MKLLLFAAGVSLVLVAGCSEQGMKTAPVQGTITYAGKPVPQGSIMFQPEHGPNAMANIKNGAYVLKTYRDGDGAVVGKHKVTLWVKDAVDGSVNKVEHIVDVHEATAVPPPPTDTPAPAPAGGGGQ